MTTDMARHYWDTLQLTISTDPQRVAYVRIMYDKGELEPGYNIMRERRFNRDAILFPEIVVVESTELEFEFRAYYEGEEEFGQTFRLHLDESPEIEITIGTEEKQAVLGLRLVSFDEPFECDDEYDDDGRYDAWV